MKRARMCGLFCSALEEGSSQAIGQLPFPSAGRLFLLGFPLLSFPLRLFLFGFAFRLLLGYLFLGFTLRLLLSLTFRYFLFGLFLGLFLHNPLFLPSGFFPFRYSALFRR